jgi:S1-C subfamily serine protease
MKFFKIFILILCFWHLGIAQGLVSYNDLSLFAKSYKNSSVSIELMDTTTASSEVIGSGFLLVKNNIFYAVTNYHVASSHKTRNQTLCIGFNYEMKKQYAWVEKATINDSINDISVLVLSQLFSLTKYNQIDSSLAKKLRVITPSFFALNDSIQQGRIAFILGYPLRIGKEYTGNKPVLRVGYVAQEPNKSTNTFLIDGTTSHGNSGSPVFSIDANTGETILIGMVRAFPDDKIELYDERKNVVALLPYNSGLTLCVTAEAILKLIPY